MPLYSSLGDRVRIHLKRKEKKKYKYASNHEKKGNELNLLERHFQNMTQKY